MKLTVFLISAAAVLLALGLSCFAFLPESQEPAPAKLRAVRQEGGYLILEGEKKVLFYQSVPKSLEGKYARANYVHPLFDLDGNVLTEDFPPDHFHHRGVFWAWHQLNVGEKRMGDSWETKDFTYDVSEISILIPDGKSIALKTLVLWKSPLWRDTTGSEKPLVRETTIIRVHQASPEARKVDFHIQLMALEDNMRLGGSEDEKGYGGFSVRIRIPDNAHFTGRRGAVVPKVTAVDAGPWIDLAGNFHASAPLSGVAILSHPSLPVFPPPWILRGNPGMQNAVFPGRTPVPLVRGKPIDLRYRLVIHRGDARQAGIDRLQATYEKE